VPIRSTAGAPLTFSVVPNYPAFPPEMVFARAPHTEEPAAVLRELGSARIAYFAGDVDRTCWRSGSADVSRLIQNAVQWVHGDARPPVTIEGDGIVETFAWETEAGYALHILNYTNPNMTHGFVRHWYPIGVQRVAFDVASGRRISKVTLLRADRAVPFTQDGRTIRFDVPSTVDYEVAALT
jgi:hypothetical protein